MLLKLLILSYFHDFLPYHLWYQNQEKCDENQKETTFAAKSRNTCRTPPDSVVSLFHWRFAEPLKGGRKAPIKQITGPHSPVPFAKELENEFVPSPTKIRDAVAEVVNFK